MLANSFENKLARSDRTLDTLDPSFGSNEVSVKASLGLQMSKEIKSVFSLLERKIKTWSMLYSSMQRIGI